MNILGYIQGIIAVFPGLRFYPIYIYIYITMHCRLLSRKAVPVYSFIKYTYIRNSVSSHLFKQHTMFKLPNFANQVGGISFDSSELSHFPIHLLEIWQYLIWIIYSGLAYISMDNLFLFIAYNFLCLYI